MYSEYETLRTLAITAGVIIFTGLAFLAGSVTV